MSSGTEFNAFELLAKLRGGQPLPESSVGGAVPTNPHAKHAQQTSIQASCLWLFIFLFACILCCARLCPARAILQKRERIEVRVELEKDIAKLNEEVVKFKFENKQLQAGKAELQQQLKDQKMDSDDTIRQLRSEFLITLSLLVFDQC